MSDYPPTCWQDIMAYDNAECMEGYMDYDPDDMTPGDNRSPSYRWGWATAHADRNHIADKFYWMRREAVREMGIGKTRH